MNKFKIGDRVVDITVDPPEHGTVKYYELNDYITGPHVLWENGSCNGQTVWIDESSLELIERKEVTMGSKYKFIDKTDADKNVRAILTSGDYGSFETVDQEAVVHYQFALIGKKHVELGINSQCFGVEDLKQLKEFINFSINKLEDAEKADQAVQSEEEL